MFNDARQRHITPICFRKRGGTNCPTTLASLMENAESIRSLDRYLIQARRFFEARWLAPPGRGRSDVTVMQTLYDHDSAPDSPSSVFSGDGDESD